MKALKVENVVKTYPGFRLGPLSFDLEPGMVLGYIGPNASGKTTTFRCLTRLTGMEAGSVEIFGHKNEPDRPGWKFDIGYVGDKHVFFERWTGETNLMFRSRFYPSWSHTFARDLARRFECPLKQKPKDMSAGNRVKLSLIAALAHSPRLLLLDEPTAGLDPVVRREVLDILFEVLEDGERSILYATHILSDISRLADELAFLINGRIMQRSGKDDLLEKWRRITFRMAGETGRIQAAVVTRREGDDHQVISLDWEKTLEDLRSRGAGSVETARMSIDEIAVEIIKGGKNVAHP
jgi:ABC-2 type transport system ATP-binding protein